MFEVNGRKVSAQEIEDLLRTDWQMRQLIADRDTLYRAIRHALVDLQFVPHAVANGDTDAALDLLQMAEAHLLRPIVPEVHLQDGRCIHPDVFVRDDTADPYVHCHTCGRDILATEL